MAGLRLAIDPTGVETGAKRAEDALDDVKRKAGETEQATDRVGKKMRETGDAASATAPKVRTVGTEMGTLGGKADKAGQALGATVDRARAVGTELGAVTGAANGAGSAIGQTGTAAGKTRDEFGRFVKAGDDVARSAKGAGEQVGKTGRKFFDLSSLAAKAGAALGALAAGYVGFAGASAAVRGIAQFDSSMSQLAAVSRATSSDLESMRDIAKELGAATEYSATQAADALGYLALAGLSAQQSIAAIPQVLDFATAAGIGLALASDLATDAVSALGLQSTDMARVMDTLANQAASSNTSVEQAASAMIKFGGIAKTAGVQVEFASAALGVLGDSGLKGAEAGTAMRSMLASLLAPTSAAQAALKDAGVALTDIDISARGLVPVLETLAGANLTTAQMAELFGREYLVAASYLIDGREKLGAYAAANEKAAGSTKEMAETIRDNLGGDLKSAMSALEGLILALGDAGLTAALRGAVQGATGLVRGLSELTEYSDILGASLGLIALRSLPSAVSALYALATSAGVATAAAGALAFAVNAIPLVALGTAAAFAYRAFQTHSRAQGEAAHAADIHTAAADSLRTAIGNLNLATEDGVEYARAIAKARLEEAAANLSAAEAALALFRAESTLSGRNRRPTELRLEQSVADQEATLAAIRAEAERLGISLENAGDSAKGIATGVRGAANESDRFRGIIYQTSLAGLTGEAALLAEQMGVAADEALRYNAALNQSAGIETPNVGLGFGGLGSIEDTITGTGFSNLGFGNLDNLPPRRRTPIASSQGRASGGGSRRGRIDGGGGGGAAEIDRTKEAYDALVASLDPAVAASQDFAQAQETINAALDKGHISATEAAGAYDLAQEAFDKATASISDGTDIWKSFQDAGASAIDRLIDGTGTLKDALLDVLKQMALAIANKQILAQGGTAVTSLGGLVMSTFAGLFDSGGTIGMGQYGIVGEYGPELVRSTGTGAVVTSRVDTARMLQPQGGQTFNIDARGAQQGVGEEIAAALRSVLPNAMAQTREETLTEVRQNLPGWQQQINIKGGLV
ncbi:phage tail tape measure protein [Salipiger marinus]|uniref:phage tail tape measure protein n=1 Tax=Salipiger marinus TaxID=555512 RepID=UPI002C7D27CB|nr:phage tail tape measure protein [Salipiger manganoxidans]MEB3419888.1 phage tail tape measure protein [Salipiger manganoxidans]